MEAALKLTPESVVLTWTEICELCPNAWVFLIDVEMDADGSIRWGRLIDHDRSMKQALARVDARDPDLVVAHTKGSMRSRSPRIEVTEQIRSVFRASR
ncbi:MAG TPA: hypothetical protein VL326_06140 [Kofleriaceae bacterium]|jgi:hypothetical protein|nr:hypothetical protein [Kofleriaceae bacterium]